MGIFGFAFLGEEKQEMITLISKRMQLPRELVEAKFDEMIQELKKFQQNEVKVELEEVEE